MRIDEGLGGTAADISVRVFGLDLDQLAEGPDTGGSVIGHGRGADCESAITQ